MTVTYFDQETQVRSSTLYDDTIAPTEANYETNPVNLEDNLNHIRSMLSHLRDAQAGDWFDALTAPSALEAGSIRGVQDVNDALHAVEKARRLRNVHSLVDVTVGAGNNFVILGTGELPAQTTAAVGAVTTKGTVVAPHGGTFGSHSLAEVAGPDALSPLNLMIIVDGSTRDLLLSGGRQIYGLLHGESGVTDGATITDTTTTRVQISFVRQNATGDDLEAVPFADIENAVINYCTRERVAHDELNEYDFLSGAIVDVPAGTTVTRQVAYDNQGATPVNLTNNAILDLEGPGVVWRLRDDLEATIFDVVEGSAGGTTQFNVHAAVDEYDNDAQVVNFASGASINSGGTRPIDVGVTDGVVASTAGDLELEAAVELLFDDGNRSGSTFSAAVKLSDTTAEWDAYEAAFGAEVSLLAAITEARTAVGNTTKTCAAVTAAANPDVDIGGTGGGANLDAQLHDLSNGTFVDDHDIYHNGQFQRVGADASANFDVYPGTSLALGQLRFEKKMKIGDVICVVSRA